MSSVATATHFLCAPWQLSLWHPLSLPDNMSKPSRPHLTSHFISNRLNLTWSSNLLISNLVHRAHYRWKSQHLRLHRLNLSLFDRATVVHHSRSHYTTGLTLSLINSPFSACLSFTWTHSYLDSSASSSAGPLPRMTMSSSYVVAHRAYSTLSEPSLYGRTASHICSNITSVNN